jgi:hypothetical protein
VPHITQALNKAIAATLVVCCTLRLLLGLHAWWSIRADTSGMVASVRSVQFLVQMNSAPWRLLLLPAPAPVSAFWLPLGHMLQDKQAQEDVLLV